MGNGGEGREYYKGRRREEEEGVNLDEQGENTRDEGTMKEMKREGLMFLTYKKRNYKRMLKHYLKTALSLGFSIFPMLH